MFVEFLARFPTSCAYSCMANTMKSRPDPTRPNGARREIRTIRADESPHYVK